MRIIISGGGTGGHVFPAIAIANAVKELQPDAEIFFVGAKGKIEMQKVPEAGYEIEGLWISGFQRKFTWKNFLFPFKLAYSLWKAGKTIRGFKPDVVVGVGGYASGPVLELATRRGIPALIQEQNSYAGVTNRLLAKKVQKICVAYEGMERYFPKEKIILTGNPVRKDILNTGEKRKEAYRHFGFDEQKKTIVILGGSLGARTINDAVEAQKAVLSEQEDIQLLWQAGRLYIDEFENGEAGKLPNVKLTKFIDRMDLAYAVADVVIARAGALTIAELLLAGKPAILIPSPNVAEDHQTQNALALVKNRAALLVKDVNAKEQMIKEAIDLLGNEKLMKTLSEQVATMAKPNAAIDIAKEVIALGK